MVVQGGFIDEFVRAGGAAVIHLVGPGLANTEPGIAPAGVGYERVLHDLIGIEAPAHPFVTGRGYGGRQLQMTSFSFWGPTDEGVLTALPPGATVLLRNADGPSMVEYPLGDGKVIVSTLTFCTTELPASQGAAFENLLLYSPFFEGLARTPGLTATPTSTPTPTPTGPTPTASSTRTRPPTPTATLEEVTPTETATPSEEPTPTATATAPPACPADCNTDGAVTVDELVLTVAISMGERDAAECMAADRDNDGGVSLNEIVGGVAGALRGCNLT
jgi:hypothetical protein